MLQQNSFTLCNNPMYKIKNNVIQSTLSSLQTIATSYTTNSHNQSSIIKNSIIQYGRIYDFCSTSINYTILKNTNPELETFCTEFDKGSLSQLEEIILNGRTTNLEHQAMVIMGNQDVLEYLNSERYELEFLVDTYIVSTTLRRISQEFVSNIAETESVFKNMQLLLALGWMVLALIIFIILLSKVTKWYFQQSNEIKGLLTIMPASVIKKFYESSLLKNKLMI